jgi:hypothetical protein
MWNIAGKNPSLFNTFYFFRQIYHLDSDDGGVHETIVGIALEIPENGGALEAIVGKVLETPDDGGVILGGTLETPEDGNGVVFMFPILYTE